jgi:hypothetical protein
LDEVALPVEPLQYAQPVDSSWLTVVRAVGWVAIAMALGNVIGFVLARPFGFPFIRSSFAPQGMMFSFAGSGIVLLQIAAGIGLLRGKPWRHSAGILYCWIAGGYAIVATAIGLWPYVMRIGFRLDNVRLAMLVLFQVGAAVQWLAFPAICLVILRQRAVRELFQRHR